MPIDPYTGQYVPEAPLDQDNPFITRQQQPQQQGMGINPMQGLQTYKQVSGMLGGGSGGAGTGGATATGTGATVPGAAGGTAAGGATGAGAGGGSAGGSAGGGFAAAGPYALIALAIAAKAEDTKTRGGISYEDQIKNVSKAPQSDWDRWEAQESLEGVIGSDLSEDVSDIYKGSFDVATGDISNYAEKDPILKNFFR